jgi:hypothetical protein
MRSLNDVAAIVQDGCGGGGVARVNGGRRGGGRFLGRRTYCNKQLCCLVQRAAMVGLGGLPREPIGSDGVVRQTAGREAGRHTSGGSRMRPGQRQARLSR